MKTDSRRLLWVFLFFLLTLCSCDLHNKLGELLYNEGMKKEAAGDHAGARDEFSGAIAQNPNFTEAYLYRGAIQLVYSNYPAAIADFITVLSVQAHAWLGFPLNC